MLTVSKRMVIENQRNIFEEKTQFHHQHTAVLKIYKMFYNFYKSFYKNYRVQPGRYETIPSITGGFSLGILLGQRNPKALPLR